ncbi:MAG TPA: alpha/beta fold hydrolase [Nannocystaceae bacterium]|nr:alpha/beta fold hydrolase [Nannocystaceae bacterium]
MARDVALVPTWLDVAAYPFTTRTFATRDGRMSYVDEGEGPTVLLVHGTPSWSFEWRHAIAHLRGRARVVAPDHLGFGLSDKPADAPYKPEDHARRLLELVRALDLRDITLVLHDFGGPIGLPVLLEEPDRVRNVVLMNTWAWAHGEDKRVRRLSNLVRSRFGRWLYTKLNASPRWLVPMSFGNRKALAKATHRQYVAPFPAPQSRIAPWVLGCELAGSDPYYASLWARHERLRERPVTIVWGSADPAFGASYLDRWRRALPDARIIELAGVGHFPQEEAPEAVTRAIADML